MKPRLQHFGYVRVSTVRQGRGVSLPEQREHIERYAASNGLTIGRWFVDQETAAKRGREAFTEMVRALRSGEAAGVIVHKIDRSARNFHDWADIHDLADLGVDVRFTTEGIDLKTRGGRLSADIQAVVAVDYVRNLREEVVKGLYGRLKAGIYPFGAPLGYRNEGAGKPKAIDPVAGRLIRRAFELYATGKYTLATLGEALWTDGLRSRSGKRVSRTTLAELLNNPFYTGVIRIQRNGRRFQGAHQPLVSPETWQRVQDVLHGRVGAKAARHEFTYRRLFRCAHCSRLLSGELQKGRVYYRCHTEECPTTSVREDTITAEMLRALRSVMFDEAELLELKAECERQITEQAPAGPEERRRVAELRLRSVDERLARLLDLAVEGAFEKEALERKKEGLLVERTKARADVVSVDQGQVRDDRRLEIVFELLRSLSACGEFATGEEWRELVARMTSNRVVDGRKPALALVPPFARLSDVPTVSSCGAFRDRLRTLGRILANWVKSDEPLPAHPKSSYTSFTSYTSPRRMRAPWVIKRGE